MGTAMTERSLATLLYALQYYQNRALLRPDQVARVEQAKKETKAAIEEIEAQRLGFENSYKGKGAA